MVLASISLPSLFTFLLFPPPFHSYFLPLGWRPESLCSKGSLGLRWPSRLITDSFSVYFVLWLSGPIHVVCILYVLANAAAKFRCFHILESNFHATMKLLNLIWTIKPPQLAFLHTLLAHHHWGHWVWVQCKHKNKTKHNIKNNHKKLFVVVFQLIWWFQIQCSCCFLCCCFFVVVLAQTENGWMFLCTWFPHFCSSQIRVYR